MIYECKVDLNCDMGESFGAFFWGNDEAILPHISSANIACGFHAGDPGIMKKTVRLAMQYNVAIGAHTGLPDLQGFGRREISVSKDEVFDMVIYQIGALNAFVKAEGGFLHHVKPHGALYNMASINCVLAEAIAEAIYKIDPNIFLYGLSNSELTKAGEKIGLKIAEEVFADRTYQQDGTLTPRHHNLSLINNHKDAVNQVLRMVKEKKVRSIQGVDVDIKADTICIHGDGKFAVELATIVRSTLISEGVKIKTIGL